MRRTRAILLVMPLMLAALPARSSQSQPEQKDETTESVTVTGARAHRIIQNFVKSLAAPARVTGKITRWQDGICPITVGLRPEAVKFVNDRMRAVAQKVGAPVNEKPDCTPNIEIVFTTDPQGLMDTVRKERPQLLGFAYGVRRSVASLRLHRHDQWPSKLISVQGALRG